MASAGSGLSCSSFTLQRLPALEIRNRLSHVQHEWAKVEPQVTAAQKRSAELNNIVSTTKVLDEMIDSRFFWAPFLQKNFPLRGAQRPVDQHRRESATTAKLVSDLAIEGLAAGREPRAAAEELRQLLREQLGQSYADVKVEFKALEDLDTIVKIAGSNMAMALVSPSPPALARKRPNPPRPTADRGPK